MATPSKVDAPVTRETSVARETPARKDTPAKGTKAAGPSSKNTPGAGKSHKRSSDIPPKRILQSAMYLSETERDVLNNADYAFTGSYYKVHRNIMSFDPLDLLPNYRGNKSQLLEKYHHVFMAVVVITIL